MTGPLTRRALGRALYEAGTIAGKYPALALSIARRWGQGAPLGPDTDVVIEGYPRSGNSFAVAAFQLAQPGPVRIAHHVHAPANVIAAVRAGIPTLVLIRPPEEAVPELVRIKPEVTMAQATRGYLRFYRPLVPYRSGFVVGLFQEVTADFGGVIRRINRRFGTRFGEFEHTDANVNATTEAAGRYWQHRAGPGLPVLGRTAGEASVATDEVKEGLEAKYRREVPPSLREQVEGTYESLARQAGSSR